MLFLLDFLLSNDQIIKNRRDIVDMSCLKIGDLFSNNSLASNPRLLFLTPEQKSFVLSIVNSIPPKWRSGILIPEWIVEFF